MNESRPTLFLSSTSVDLAEFRKVAIHVCKRLGIDIVAMEDFGPNPPASTLVQISNLAIPDALIEIEAVAVIDH